METTEKVLAAALSGLDGPVLYATLRLAAELKKRDTDWRSRDEWQRELSRAAHAVDEEYWGPQ
jgi:glycogen debranching enzyme